MAILNVYQFYPFRLNSNFKSQFLPSKKILFWKNKLEYNLVLPTPQNYHSPILILYFSKYSRLINHNYPEICVCPLTSRFRWKTGAVAVGGEKKLLVPLNQKLWLSKKILQPELWKKNHNYQSPLVNHDLWADRTRVIPCWHRHTWW